MSAAVSAEVPSTLHNGKGAADTPLTSDNDTETCENENGRRGATNTRDGLTHHSPLTRRRAVVSVSPDTQSKTVTTAYGTLAGVVRQWSEAAGGGLTALQVRELLRALDNLHCAESHVQQWMTR